MAIGKDSLKTRQTLTVQGKRYEYFSLTEAARTLGDISRLPVTLKVLL
jgi:aconitate hydratase